MNVETVEITSLSNDPANLRIHSDAQIEKLVGMLRRWGQTATLTFQPYKKLDWSGLKPFKQETWNQPPET